MDAQGIEQALKQAIGQQIEVEQEGYHRYPIFTPFTLEDGDHFHIVLRRDENTPHWIITDEGDTLMHLSYWMDYASLKKGTRQQLIQRVLQQFSIKNQNGELQFETTLPDIGSSVFNFLQALTRLSDITYLSRERAKATFMEDFREFIGQVVPQDRLVWDYHHPEYDQQKIYPVDARINQRQIPLFIFAIGNDARCRDVTINLHNYNNWGISFQSVAIFQDQTQIARDVLARFSDVADKQFASLESSKIQIKKYLERALSPM